MKDSQAEEEAKRLKIEADLEKSLEEIREKIRTHERESQDIEKETVELKAKVQEARARLEALQSEAEKKTADKQEEVRAEKQELLDRLQLLEKDAEEIGRVSQEYAQVEKRNFDNKLSLHIKQTRFQEYASSFENTARIISQCKEELFKSVARLNESRARKEQDQKKAEDYDKQFLALLSSVRPLSRRTTASRTRSRPPRRPRTQSARGSSTSRPSSRPRRRPRPDPYLNLNASANGAAARPAEPGRPRRHLRLRRVVRGVRPAVLLRRRVRPRPARPVGGVRSVLARYGDPHSANGNGLAIPSCADKQTLHISDMHSGMRTLFTVGLPSPRSSSACSACSAPTPT